LYCKCQILRLIVTGSDHDFKEYARRCITDVNKSWMADNSTQCNTSSAQTDTWLAPLIQMGPFKIMDDEHVTEQLFKTAETSDKLVLASGYFNLTSKYLNVIMKQSKAEYDILTASPEVRVREEYCVFYHIYNIYIGL